MIYHLLQFWYQIQGTGDFFLQRKILTGNTFLSFYNRIVFGETLQRGNLGHLCLGGGGADVSSAACSEVLSACCGEALLGMWWSAAPFLGAERITVRPRALALSLIWIRMGSAVRGTSQPQQAGSRVGAGQSWQLVAGSRELIPTTHHTVGFLMLFSCLLIK